MPHQISEECINCGSCAMECSFSAISKGTLRSRINPETCRDCGACAVICPVLAIQAMGEGAGVLQFSWDPKLLH